MRIISAQEFRANAKVLLEGKKIGAEQVDDVVNEIIAAIRAEGDTAVMRYASRFEKKAPEKFEVPLDLANAAWESLQEAEPELASALELAADHIQRFAELQKKQFSDFETEITPGLFTGQRVIPIDRAAIYAPGGRFPLISSVLMGLIPAAVAGVKEKLLVSPPCTTIGLPDRRILAAAHLAGADRIFSLGGAQAIAALALGTESIPRVDLIVGPGNKYVAAAKRILYGEVGIDFVAGPTDVLMITDDADMSTEASDLIAADMIAQAEHDPDARARALVPDRKAAEQIEQALEKQLGTLPPANTAKAIAKAIAKATAESSLETGGIIIVYRSKEEAINIANEIAPEHLELHVSSPEEWTGKLRNYGSIFIGALAAEVLGDYSAGINHTLPTSG